MTPTHPVEAHAESVLLDGIVAAMCGHGDRTAAQKESRSNAIRTLIAAAQPADAIQTMLLGQCLMFNEVIADAGKDLLRLSTDALKLRAQANLIGLNRTLRQNMDAFLKARDKPAATPPAAKAVAAKPPAEPAPQKADPIPAASPAPDEDASWLDEPTVTWLIETPAEEVARLRAEQAVSDQTAAPPVEPRRVPDHQTAELALRALFAHMPEVGCAAEAVASRTPEITDSG